MLENDCGTPCAPCTGLSELNMLQLRTLVTFDYDTVVTVFDDEVRLLPFERHTLLTLLLLV